VSLFLQRKVDDSQLLKGQSEIFMAVDLLGPFYALVGLAAPTFFMSLPVQTFCVISSKKLFLTKEELCINIEHCIM
jgi:hypothetical protein